MTAGLNIPSVHAIRNALEDIPGALRQGPHRGVDTPMIQLGPEVDARQRATIPEPLREQYRQHFLPGATAIGDNFKFIQPDAFADAVWKRIISAKRLRPLYLIGPQVAVLPWIHRLLPAQQVQNIWRRMFSTKHGAKLAKH